MKRKALLVSSAGVLVLCAGVPSQADELLRFKSGYEMMVVSHRVEGKMIMVTLQGGGEVGFPAETLDLLEGGKPSSGPGGPSIGYSRVPSRAGMMDKFSLRPEELEDRILARGTPNGSGATIGYSYGGASQQRFHGGPEGPLTASGKIGSSLLTTRRPLANGPQGPAATADPKQAVPTLRVIMPSGNSSAPK